MIEDSVSGFNVIRTEYGLLAGRRSEVGLGLHWQRSSSRRDDQVPGSWFMLRPAPRQNEPALQALERWSKQSLELLRDCRRPLSLLAEHLVSIWVWPRRVIPKLYSLCLFIVEDLLAEQEA